MICSSGTSPGIGLPSRVHHYRRHSHYIAAVPGGRLQLLNGVTCHAGDAVFVEFAVDMRVPCEGASQNADGIVATVAMTGKFDALGT